MTVRRIFVIRCFGAKKDSKGRLVDFELVHDKLIAPGLERCGLAGGTTAEVVDAGNIRSDMFALILEADIVICDITVHNANVFYELGIRHALRKKHTVLIKGDPSADVTPFDLSTDRYLKYPTANPAVALDALVETLQATLRTNRETDSPIFLMLPTLTEADPAEVTLVPLDFIEEVERAEAAADKGWLRCKAIPGDIESNLALANLYEREFRANGRETLLEASNQGIRQVLEAERTTPAQRAEALAL
jgi:hypothetical protein